MRQRCSVSALRLKELPPDVPHVVILLAKLPGDSMGDDFAAREYQEIRRLFKHLRGAELYYFPLSREPLKTENAPSERGVYIIYCCCPEEHVLHVGSSP